MDKFKHQCSISSPKFRDDCWYFCFPPPFVSHEWKLKPLGMNELCEKVNSLEIINDHEFNSARKRSEGLKRFITLGKAGGL